MQPCFRGKHHLLVLLLASTQSAVASLALDKAVVNASLHHQLGMSALLSNPASLHHHNIGGVPDCGQSASTAAILILTGLASKLLPFGSFASKEALCKMEGGLL